MPARGATTATGVLDNDWCYYRSWFVCFSPHFIQIVAVRSLITGFGSRGLQLDRHPSDGALQSRSWRNYRVEEGVSVMFIRQDNSHGRCLARLLVIIGSAATVGVWPISC
jgi:hypothetical protein